MSGKNAREPLEQRAELAADLVRDSYALFRQPVPAVKDTFSSTGTPSYCLQRLCT